MTSAERIFSQVRVRPVCTVCFVLIVMDLVFVSCPCELVVRRGLDRDISGR